ncbi:MULTISPECIES: LrgB family protein [unclassified Oscillibacter]|uniref:LrgB family protein n=1 Tax=unclassified Oscillibacter TaxID=2629304 RepID=UPI0025DFAD3E|nr:MULTISPECIES: LrgB family protein [unclassified Oscillibacter]
MMELTASPFFGVTLSILAYWVGMSIQKKVNRAYCNGMLIAVALVILTLTVFHIPYKNYYVGGSLINLFLGPATACLAVSIYTKKDLLKTYWLPVLAGCAAGAMTSIVCIYGLSRLFGLNREMVMSLLPKSVTMPIAAAVAEGNGGLVPVAAAAVVFTGILGNLVAPLLIRVFRVRNPMAAGLGIGACSHAVGTAKALEIGETEGAMSGLAIGLCGLITSLLSLLFGLLP